MGRLSKQSPEQESLRTFYKAYIDAIKYSKTQQWQVANYSLLIQAAIFTGVKYVNETPDILWPQSLANVFIWTSILIALFSLTFIWSYYFNIETYRTRKRFFTKEPKMIKNLKQFLA